MGKLSTAHAQRDPTGGGWINVGTDINPPFSSSYHVFRLADEAPSKREILASIPCADRASPNWLHSFGLTRERVVVIEQPATYSVGAMLGLAKASHGSIDWKPAEIGDLDDLIRLAQLLDVYFDQNFQCFGHFAFGAIWQASCNGGHEFLAIYAANSFVLRTIMVCSSDTARRFSRPGTGCDLLDRGTGPTDAEGASRPFWTLAV